MTAVAAATQAQMRDAGLDFDELDAAAGKIDDLAYLDRLLQITGALQGIDRRRVHLAGYSNGGMLAYRYACVGCGAPLHRAELDGGVLTCLGCRRRFELPLAGRAIGEDLQLAPVPLLEEDGLVRVAVA